MRHRGHVFVGGESREIICNWKRVLTPLMELVNELLKKDIELIEAGR